jgi:hypothetical protein
MDSERSEKKPREPQRQPEHQVDLSQFSPQEHDLIQRGGFIVCRTPGHEHGTYAPPGKTLTKVGGRYKFIPMRIIDNKQP